MLGCSTFFIYPRKRSTNVGNLQNVDKTYQDLKNPTKTFLNVDNPRKRRAILANLE